ncbi:MAG: hypothetical protein WDO74_17410 [Pseudomonadota bacterium]
MSDALSRLRLPLLLGSLMLLVGGSKLDSVRPLEGQIVALLVPLIAVSSGVSPFRDAHSSLRNWVFALGALVLVLAELGPYRVVFEDTVAAPALGITLLLLLALLLAVVFEVAGAQRGLRSRLSAWFGLAIVFALYFPAHAAINNLFGSVFAAFLIALFLGGGTGLCVGEFAVRRARARA